MGAPNATGWTAESWESAMQNLVAAADDSGARDKQKAMRKKKHAFKPLKGDGGRSKNAPCALCGLGSQAPVHDPDNDGDNDPVGEPDKDAKAPAASHRTCKSCGAHMATGAGTCQSCGAKWTAALEDAKTPSGANAPYKIKKCGDQFCVVNNTGETKAKFASRDKALTYLRALYANVPGAGKRADKVKFSGKAKQRIPKKGD